MTTPAQRAHIEQVKQQSLDRIQSVLRLTQTGMTQKAACDKLGLNHYVMSRNIRRWKRAHMSEEEARLDEINLKPKPERNQEMRDRWLAGESLEDLSAYYGIHANVCWRIIKREKSDILRLKEFESDPDFMKAVEERMKKIWERQNER